MTRLRTCCVALCVCLAVAVFAEPAVANPVAPPGRSGPLRSCGSGAGLGLAGIGVVWGLLWAGRAARRPDDTGRG